MKNSIKLLDIFALTVDLPEFNLLKGQVGTVVEILADSNAFEVEFSDRQGRTFESIGLLPEQIMVLHFEPMLPLAVIGRSPYNRKILEICHFCLFFVVFSG